MKLEFSRQILEKCSNITCRGNLFCGNRIVPYGRMDLRTDGQLARQTADISKPVVAFHNFANAPIEWYNSEISNALRELSVFCVVFLHPIVSRLEWFATSNTTFRGNTEDRVPSDATSLPRWTGRSLLLFTVTINNRAAVSNVPLYSSTNTSCKIFVHLSDRFHYL